MAINFPNNPSLNQTYSAGDRTWFWNGTYWQQQSTTIGYSGSQGFTGSRGAATVLKGSVATEQDLPIPYGGDIGDGFLVEATGFVWLWDGSSWDVFGRFTGYTGSRGVGILDVDIINDELILTYSDSTQENLGRIVGYDGSSGFTGSRGEAGTSFAIKGSVPTPQDLPDPYFGDIGDGFIVESTGDLYIWDGSLWFNSGQIVGPQGFTGSRGQDGIIGVDGFTGSQGDQGYTGSKGEQGNFGGVTFDYTFLANTDSSLAPGDGNLKFNDLNMFSATELYIGDTDDNTVNLDNYLATIDASTSELKGHFRISRKSRPEDFVIFAITGVSVDAGEYFVVPCAFLSGQLTDSSTTFEQDDDILITFARTGDKGDTGFVGSRGDTGFSGSQGAPGTSFAIKGSVPTPQDLPDPYFGDIGDGFIVESTGDLYVWDGSQWFNAGQIVGPQGFTGSQGDLGYAGSQGDLGYAGSQGESTFTWGPTAPVNPAVGDRWYDTKRGFLVVYVDDGDSLQWVEVSASGFLGQQGYTGSAGNLTADVDQSTAGRVLINDGTNAQWASGAFSFRNKLINGNFDIWQRGTSQTSNGYGSADRWRSFSSGTTKTASQQAFALGQTDVPNNPKYFMRHVVSSVAGASNYASMDQKIEGVETLSGKTATLSFWAKADASKNITINLTQYFGSGGSPSDDVRDIGLQLVALTTSWTKYTISIDIPSVSGKTLGTNGNDYLYFNIWFDAGSDYDARSASLGQQSGTFDIAQVQIEEGSAATPFEMRPIGMENQLCMRYYQYCGTSSSTGPLCPLYMGTSTSARFQWPLTVPLRNTPSIQIISGTPFARYPNSAMTGYVSTNITSFPTASMGGSDKSCSTSVGFVVTVSTGLAGGAGLFVGAVIAYFDAEL